MFVVLEDPAVARQFVSPVDLLFDGEASHGRKDQIQYLLRGKRVLDVAPTVLETLSRLDGAIVLDIDHGQMFRLNPVGALILESLGKGCAETEIAQKIGRQYNISEERASADIRAFLESLEEHKLVRVRRGDGIS